MAENPITDVSTDVVTKQVGAAIDRMMETAVGDVFPTTFGGFRQFVGYGIREIDEVSPWWSQQRDRDLQRVVHDGSNLAQVAALATNKLATIPLRIRARDESIASHAQQAAAIQKRLIHYSEFATGWYAAMVKFVQDYLTTDNGGFLEIIGQNQGSSTEPLVGPVLGVRHLDSLRCTRMSDPIYPVRYSATDGKYYDFHASRIIAMSQLPSSRREMNGVGYCSVSRALLVSRYLLSAQMYKEGKMGTMPAQRIIVADGMTAEEVLKMMVASRSVIENLGLQGLDATVLVGGRSVDLKAIPLAEFDKYDEETTVKLGMHALALAFGLEPSEVFPEEFGTRSTADVRLQLSRGKLPNQFVTQFLTLLQSRVLPDHLEARMEFPDDHADQQRAVIADIKARQAERLLQGGAVSKRHVLSMMYRDGDITYADYVVGMRELGFTSSGRPIESVIFEPTYSNIVIIDPMIMVPQANDPQLAMQRIMAQRAIALQALTGAANSAQSERALNVVYAMDKLALLYQMPQENGEEPPARPEEEEEDDYDRRQPEPTGRNEAKGRMEVAPALAPFF